MEEEERHPLVMLALARRRVILGSRLSAALWSSEFEDEELVEEQELGRPPFNLLGDGVLLALPPFLWPPESRRSRELDRSLVLAERRSREVDRSLVLAERRSRELDRSREKA